MSSLGLDREASLSPDPITLPSSPLSGRKPKNARSTRKPTPARRYQRATASPSKSLILDTPQAGEASPWRIKVTVQAEPRDGTPGKKTTKTMTVPLKSPSAGPRSSSPTKKRDTPKKQSPEKRKVGRPRKRKAGTPLNEMRSAPQLRSQQSIEPEPEPELEPVMMAPAIESATDDDDDPAPLQTTPRRASGRLARLSAQWSNGTGRTKRLSVAREELDQALQDAVGPHSEGLGDLTLNRAEDFTMISMESLQSARDASLAHLSHLNANRSQNDQSGLSVSYLPSSPPKNRYHDISARARSQSSLGSPFEPTPHKRTSLSVPFSTKSSAKGKSSLRHEVDAMSWQPTGLAKLRPSSRSAEKQRAVEEQWQQDRTTISRQISNADPEDVVVVEDDGNVSEDELNEDQDVPEDLWQDEASRPAETDHSQDEREENVDSDFRPTHSPSEAEDPNYKPHHISSQRSDKFQDLFAHIPDKPPRPKIPRTWRRTSGMDFSYSDSPAHPPLEEVVESRRHSTDGSGVLTPPSTDESEEDVSANNLTAEMQEEVDDQLHSEYTQVEHDDVQEEIDSGELQDEVNDQLHSEFTQPEAEATRFHQDDYDDDEMIDDEDESSRNDSKDPLDDGDLGDGADPAQEASLNDSTTHNTSQVHLKEKPKRRPARKPTMDLEDLLGLKSSPRKVPSPKQRSEHISVQKKSSPIQRSAGHNGQAAISDVHRNRLLKNNAVRKDAFTTEDGFNSVRTDDLLTNPPVFRHLKELRDSGVKHFDGNGQYQITEPSEAKSIAAAVVPKRRGRQYFGRGHPNNSQTESTVTESFASKESAQPVVRPQVQVQQARSQLKNSFGPKPVSQLALAQNEKTNPLDRFDISSRGQYGRRRELSDQTDTPRQNADPELDAESRAKVQLSQSFQADTYEEDEDEEMDDVYEQEETSEPMPSYQENLNLDSPTKIKMNFNDSSTRDSSWLSTVNRRPPLFGTQISAQDVQQQSPQPHISPPRQDVFDTNSQQPSLFSRLTTTFWSSLQRDPPQIIPILQPKPYEAPLITSTLRSQIRSRYGVLSETFPWTMSHMRTLHRMLNSTLSKRNDSIIPRKGKLPFDLEKCVDTTQYSIAEEYPYVFERRHAYTILAFLQTLVPEETVEAMRNGEVEVLGDDVAKDCRGYYDPVRHGDDPLYAEEVTEAGLVEEGRIGVDFLIRTLGDCVKANDILREREKGKSDEELFGGETRPGTRAD